jgi:hypothetical protein
VDEANETARLSLQAEPARLVLRDAQNVLHEVPLAAIERIALVAVGVSGRLLSLRLDIFRRGDAPSLSLSFVVPALDRREEAIDLLFRLAHATAPPGVGGVFRGEATPAFAWYAVKLCDHATLSLELRRSPSPDARRVPAPEGPPGYETDEPARRIMPPAYQWPKFEPSAFLSRDEVSEWRVGHRVLLQRFESIKAPHELSVYLPAPWVVLVGAMLSAITAISLLYGWLPIFLFAIGFSALFTMVLHEGDGYQTEYRIRRIRPSRRVIRQVTFDWRRQTVELLQGRERQTVSFRNVRGVLLRGQKGRLSRGGESYWCEIALQLQAGEILVTASEAIAHDPYRAYEALCPMAAELASGLQVPWEWQS